MASTLKLNTLTGASTAGSIAVTGEGNSTTTNLQQGLAKQWGRVVQTSTQSLADSLNTSSISDTGTGKTVFVFSNNMRSGTDYSLLGTANQEGCGTEHSTMTASQYEIRVQSNDGSFADASQVSTAIMGDLA
jgi:hypothetical protein